MKEIKINYSGQIVILTKKGIKAEIPENGKKILNYFLPLRFDKYNICVEDYKIFSDVDWHGDDDCDGDTVWLIVCMYVGHVLGVDTFSEEGSNFPIIEQVSDITDTQIFEIESLLKNI